MDFKNQPVSHVRWVHRSSLRANDYNPNKVNPIELDLLALSIKEDGWTQPIVARSDGEIVDGYHRWLVSEREEIFALTDGYVPVVRTDKPLADQILSTIRHNRARGVHSILPMSEIVRRLIDDYGLDETEVCQRLGMEAEEIERLIDNAPMPSRFLSHPKSGKRAGKDKGFSKGWIPRK